MRDLPLLRYDVIFASRMSASSSMAPAKLTTSFPTNVAPAKLPPLRFAPVRSVFPSFVPIVWPSHMIGQLSAVAVAGRAWSSARVQGGGGEGGGGDGGGGRAGKGGGPAPQLTAICASAASPWYPQPRTYLKVNAGEWTGTVISFHALPWSPLRLHTASSAALIKRSVPMLEPYMWQ